MRARAAGVVAGLALVGSLGTAAPAQAADAGTLTITVPGSAAGGTSSVGGSALSIPMGTVQVSSSSMAVGGSWSASVSTSGFTTGGGAYTLPGSRVQYWSGVGSLLNLPSLVTCVGAQPTALNAQYLGASRPAMTCSNASPITGAGPTTASWSPTLIVHPNGNDIAGTYTGTITHSVS